MIPMRVALFVFGLAAGAGAVIGCCSGHPCIARCTNSRTPADAPGGLRAKMCSDSYKGGSISADNYSLPASCSLEWLQ